MVFDQDHIDLGTIKKGEVKTFEYIFTNAGKEDIKIDIVSACECSTVDWTRTYIKPGEKGRIEVIFDSTEKEKSETVDVDVDLLNTDPKTGTPIFKRLTFSFKFAE